MGDSEDEMEALSGQCEDYVDKKEEKERDLDRGGGSKLKPIKLIIKAILEKEAHGQLCPQTVKELNTVLRTPQVIDECIVEGCHLKSGCSGCHKCQKHHDKEIKQGVERSDTK